MRSDVVRKVTSQHFHVSAQRMTTPQNEKAPEMGGFWVWSRLKS